MTAPVDVLAVMDRDAADADAHRSHLTIEPIDKADLPESRRSESDEARAAVAELLEVSELVRDAIDNDGVSEALFDRLTSSLARCKGGAA